MKQYSALKKLLSLAATTAVFSLVSPAFAQDAPEQDNAGADAEAAAEAETPQAPAEQDDSPQDSDAESTEVGDAAEADGAQDAEQADVEGAEEGAAAEEQDGEEQSEEEVDPTASLRGITWEKRFQEVDTDNSSTTEESELAQAYQPELEEAGWSPEQAVSRFDRDEDNRLGPTEYLFFMSGLQQQLSGEEQLEQQAQR